MTIYTKTLEVPANTDYYTAKVAELEIDEDVITKIRVGFPVGCAYLVKVQILYGLEVLAPGNEDEAIVGHGETVEFKMFWKVPEKPCTIHIIAWNEDDTYDHKVKVEIEALPYAVAFWYKAVGKFVSLFSRLIGL